MPFVFAWTVAFNMMPSLAAYTAKECDCEWASQHACANGVDDGSICWSPCCSRNQSFDATRLSVSPRHEPLTVNCSVELSVQRGRHELVISTPRSAPSLKSVPLHSRGWTLWLLDIRGKLVARHAMQGSDDPPDPAELLEHTLHGAHMRRYRQLAVSTLTHKYTTFSDPHLIRLLIRLLGRVKHYRM